MHAALLALMVAAVPGKSWEIVVTDQKTKEAKTYKTNEKFSFAAGSHSCVLEPLPAELRDDTYVQEATLICVAVDTDKEESFGVTIRPQKCAWSSAKDLAPVTGLYNGTLEILLYRKNAEGSRHIAVETKCLK
jgi:hypothetical protein